MIVDVLRIVCATTGLLLVGAGGALLAVTVTSPAGAWRRLISPDAALSRAVGLVVFGGGGSAATLAVDQLLRVGDDTVTWRLTPALVFAGTLLCGVVILAARAVRTLR